MSFVDVESFLLLIKVVVVVVSVLIVIKVERVILVVVEVLAETVGDFFITVLILGVTIR